MGKGSAMTSPMIRADAPELLALVEAAQMLDGFLRGHGPYERSGYGPNLRAAIAPFTKGGDA